MRSFGRIVEIKENTPGIWYARFTHVDGPDEASEFLKFRRNTAPTPAEVRAEALSHIFHLNNLPELIPMIPELAPQVAGLSAGQQVTLNLIWAFVKVWLRQLIGRQ